MDDITEKTNTNPDDRKEQAKLIEFFIYRFPFLYILNNKTKHNKVTFLMKLIQYLFMFKKSRIILSLQKYNKFNFLVFVLVFLLLYIIYELSFINTILATLLLIPVILIIDFNVAKLKTPKYAQNRKKDKNYEKLLQDTERHYIYEINESLYFQFEFDEINKIVEYKMPKFLEDYINIQYHDKFSYYIYNSGIENGAIASLHKIEYNLQDNVLLLKLKQASFLDIYFTHYNADTKLAYKISNEYFNFDNIITLRSIFEPYYINWISTSFDYKKLIDNKSTILSKIKSNVSVPGELPGSIGVTGLVIYGDKAVLQMRSRAGADPSQLTATFSGTMDVYADLPYYINNIYEKFSIREFASIEFHNEYIEYLETIMKGLTPEERTRFPIRELSDIFNYEIFATALVIQGDNLYQFEVIIILKYLRECNLINSFIPTLDYNSYANSKLYLFPTTKLIDLLGDEQYEISNLLRSVIHLYNAKTNK